MKRRGNGSVEPPEVVFLIGGVMMEKVSNDAFNMYRLSIGLDEERRITEVQAHQILNRIAKSLGRSENIEAMLRLRDADFSLYQLEKEELK